MNIVMYRITSQPYIQVLRTIEWNKQYTIEQQQQLDLYEDKIITGDHQFALQDVLDISYRTLSVDSGLLYLHTNQGVFTYNVHSNPNHFIETYKKLK